MKRITSLVIVCLMSLLISGCAANKTGLIKVHSKGFSISPPPAGWDKQPSHFPPESSVSRELSSGSIYSIEWRNKKGSSIGMSAVKAVGQNGEPLIITNIFQHSAIAYMQEGHFHDLEKLREECPDLTQEYANISHASEQLKEFDMYKTELTSYVDCNLPNNSFKLIFEMAGIWSNKYYYTFQLTSKEFNYDSDIIVFRNLIDSLRPL